MKTRPWWAGSSACKSWRRWASAPARAQACNQVSANTNTRTPCNAHKVTAIGGCTLASKAREKNCTAILSGMSVGVPACSDDGTALATHRGVGMTNRRAHDVNDVAESQEAAEEQSAAGCNRVETRSRHVPMVHSRDAWLLLFSASISTPKLSRDLPQHRVASHLPQHRVASHTATRVASDSCVATRYTLSVPLGCTRGQRQTNDNQTTIPKWHRQPSLPLDTDRQPFF